MRKRLNNGFILWEDHVEYGVVKDIYRGNVLEVWYVEKQQIAR